MFTHRHAFGTSGGDQPVSEQLASDCLQELKAHYPSVFAEPKFPIVHNNSVHFEHRIRLKDESAPPPHRKIYPLDQEELAELKKQIVDMLSKNQIRPSDSPYGAPILFAKKKDGRLRLCVDYRALNKNTIVDSYPLPHIDELLSRLQGAKYFSRLDLRDGYFHVPIAEQDVHKTAFSCRYGTYEYLVMPFGLMNAPGTFQRIMNQVFFDMLDKNVIVYLDDILIFTKTEAEHKSILNEVFRRLAHYSLFVKESKCALFLHQVEFLGHVVTSEGISVQPGKIDAVRNWPQPKTVTELQQFLGLCNYYWRFILGYATVAAPLTNLLKGKPSSLQFSSIEIKAFQDLKDRLTTAPVLKVYDPALPIRVQSDASKLAVGAILEQ